MKKIASLILAAIMALSLVACNGSGSSSGSSGSTATNSGGESLKVAFTCNNLGNDTVVETLEPIQELCDERGYEFTQVSYDSDVSKLVDTLENFLTAEYDIVMFQSVGGDAVNDVDERMKEAGIVVISYDDPAHVGTYYLTQSDEEIGTAIGEAAAEFVNENLGGKADAVALALPSNETLTIRSNAFTKAYEENCDGKVLFTYDLNNYSGDFAAIADSISQAYPETKIILDIADSVNVQLVEGLTSAGYEVGDIFLFGCDTVPEVRNAWLNDEETMIVGSVYTHLPESLMEAFNRAVETTETGTVSDPEIHQEVVATSAENVSELFGK